jgi:hypothetical protein
METRYTNLTISIEERSESVSIDIENMPVPPTSSGTRLWVPQITGLLQGYKEMSGL